MSKILLLLMSLFSLQMYGGTVSMDVQEKEEVDVKLENDETI